MAIAAITDSILNFAHPALYTKAFDRSTLVTSRLRKDATVCWRSIASCSDSTLTVKGNVKLRSE